MSKVEELIKEYCPNGVEYKKLKDITEIKTGKGITKKDMINEGMYPIVSGGKEPMGFYNEKNRNENTVTVARAGTAGYVNFMTCDFYLNDKCFSVIPTDGSLIPKYLYYALKNEEEQIVGMKSKGTVPTITVSKLQAFIIPVPPLPVQKEIVRILDTFTELTAELKTKLTEELTARKKQYEYYRNEIFSFNIKGGTIERLLKRYCPNGVEHKKINDISIIKRGKRITKKQIKENGKYPIVSGGTSFFGRFDEFNRKANTITISSYGSAGYVNYITEDFWANDVCLCVYPKDHKKLNNKYLYYCLKNNQNYLYKNTTKAIPDHIETRIILELNIPVPPLPVQEEIAHVLDSFSTMCTNLSSGLPAEIEARKKQYEYYRNKLLTFNESVG